MQLGGEVTGRRLNTRHVFRYTKGEMVPPCDDADIQAAIRHALGRGTKRIEDVAEFLHISKSTLQRRLSERGTSYTALRRRAQVAIALKHLTAGKPVFTAAHRALVSSDHLCVIVREETGLTPGQIARAAELSRRIELMREHDPPTFGSSLYRRQIRRWHRIDAELDRLLGDLGSANPLANWAKELLVSAARPDFRRQPYRRRIRAKRKRERDQVEALMRDFDRFFETSNPFGSLALPILEKDPVGIP